MSDHCPLGYLFSFTLDGIRPLKKSPLSSIAEISRFWLASLAELTGASLLTWLVNLKTSVLLRESNDDNLSLLSTGASHYGICDIEALIKDTQSSHKFESKYDQTLIAPYDEEHMHVFRERSPIHYMDQMSGALAIFQGDEDKVEPRYEENCLLNMRKQRRRSAAR